MPPESRAPNPGHAGCCLVRFHDDGVVSGDLEIVTDKSMPVRGFAGEFRGEGGDAACEHEQETGK